MKYILIIIVLIFFTSCSIKYDTSNNIYINKSKISKLTDSILNLSENIDKDEALNVAQTAILYSKQLSNEYELVSPPLYHNYLVQMGVKKRGYCHHFAKDLIQELKKLNLKTLDLRWVIDKKGEYFEHSSIVVSAKNKPIQDGIVFDAWRNSGDLYWNNFKKDTRYKWFEDIKRSKIYGTVN